MATLWMMGSIASFSLMAIAGRELSEGFSTFEIMLWRSLVGFAIVVVALWVSARGLSQLATNRPGLHSLRNVAHFTGQNCWFYAIGVIPLAQVFAFEFTSPIWVALFAPLVLGERFTVWRALAAALGFAGILLVARPFGTGGGGDLAVGQMIALAAAVGFAINLMATKRLSATETTLCILFYMTLSQTVMALICEGLRRGDLPPLPGADAAVWLIVVGCCGLSAHYCVTTAFRYADATIVTPMDFFRLPLIAVVGAVLYDEALDAFVVLGGALVFLGNFLNLRAERQRGPSASPQAKETSS